MAAVEDPVAVVGTVVAEAAAVATVRTGATVTGATVVAAVATAASAMVTTAAVADTAVRVVPGAVRAGRATDHRRGLRWGDLRGSR